MAPLPIADQYHQLTNIKLKIHHPCRIKNLKLKKRTSTRIKDDRRMVPRQKLTLLKILGQIPQTEFQPKITSQSLRMIVDIMPVISLICLVLSMFALLRSS
jgi:hypothetical protein